MSEQNNNELVINKLVHYPQEDDWDCGLACVYTILKYFNIELSYEELLKQVNTKSIWSIDLVYLLNKYKINIEYNTITIGIDNSLSSYKKFYSESYPHSLSS